jgi:hypothetical protein
MTPKSLADASRGDEGPAQWEAGEPEHNRVSKDPDGTPAYGVRERPGETDQAKRAARDQTGPGLGPTCESWDSEQEARPKKMSHATMSTAYSIDGHLKSKIRSYPGTVAC